MNKSVQHQMKGANHRLKPPTIYLSNSDGNSIDSKTLSASSKESRPPSEIQQLKYRSPNVKNDAMKPERHTSTIGRVTSRIQRSGIPQPGAIRSKPLISGQNTDDTEISNKKKITRSRSPRSKTNVSKQILSYGG